MNRYLSSSAVRWWDFNEWAQPLLDAVGEWPTVGTQAWFDLADDDPRKLAALYDGARHWALRVETCQIAECQASSDVSAAADWSAIGQKIRQRNQFFAAKPWLKRVAS
jgi:hypothetical protein